MEDLFERNLELIEQEEQCYVSIAYHKTKRRKQDELRRYFDKPCDEGNHFQYYSRINVLDSEHINNYMKDCSFEKETSALTDNIFIVKKEARSGKKCLLIKGPAKIQLPEVPKTGIYTLSLYLKSNQDTEISIYSSNLELVSEHSLIATKSKKYKRCILNAYLKSDLLEYFIQINPGNNAYLYIDDIQLEQGEIANNINWIENSNFTFGSEGWIITSNEQDNWKIAAQSFEFKNSKKNQILSQDIFLNGKEKEQIYFSFNYLLKDPAKQQIILELKEKNYTIKKYTYSNLPNDVDWQKFEKTIDIPMKFDQITIQIVSNSPLLITNFYLGKEECMEKRTINIFPLLRANKIRKYFQKTFSEATLKYNEKNFLTQILFENKEYNLQYNHKKMLTKIALHNQNLLEINYTENLEGIEYIKYKNHIIYIEQSEEDKINYIETEKQHFEFLYNQLNQLTKIISEEYFCYFEYSKREVTMHKVLNEKEECFRFKNMEEFQEQFLKSL